MEFLFLTGCRPCEVYPITWNDIKWDKRVIVFSKSYESRSKALSKGRTKNGTIRTFPFYPRLEQLLLRLRDERFKGDNNALVFSKSDGRQFSRNDIAFSWQGYSKANGKRFMDYPGIVTQLAKEGKITQYLKPYSTRHTFISLQVLGALNNPNDKTNFVGQIKYIADLVGNSVETIQKHYLDKPRNAELLDI
ncbi:tyrosine-type recombinase/integrase [Gloeothece verrucosa]|uniref:tyrosine-type recombinase/integrase n=1 Tax=Gloeothece verrucosa TaxID=2546359 RepID=UPI002479B7BF|nr:tyrosine-type recombinase/integrase [Gloeothece verrucosa]